MNIGQRCWVKITSASSDFHPKVTDLLESVSLSPNSSQTLPLRPSAPPHRTSTAPMPRPLEGHNSAPDLFPGLGLGAPRVLLIKTWLCILQDHGDDYHNGDNDDDDDDDVIMIMIGRRHRGRLSAAASAKQKLSTRFQPQRKASCHCHCCLCQCCTVIVITFSLFSWLLTGKLMRMKMKCDQKQVWRCYRPSIEVWRPAWTGVGAVLQSGELKLSVWVLRLLS